MASDSLRELTFPVPWGIIAAKAWGDPCAPPVLMLHGIQDNAGTFDRLLPYLPRTYYYLCLDLPGHGLSSRMPKGFRLDFMDYLLSINRIVRQLGWARFTLIGHSLGGQLGEYYAAMYPEQVDKLVVLDAFFLDNVPMEEYFNFIKETHDRVIAVESKILDGEPPSYTYEVALEKMINNRRSFITREAAEALVPRNIKKGKNGYHFSPDQRLKLSVSLPLSREQHAINFKKICCPFLLVITEDLYKFMQKVMRVREHTEKHNYLAILKENPLFEIAVVEGAHDVHSISPQVVAPHIIKFLSKFRSKL